MYLRLLKQGTRKVQIHKYTNAKYPARVSADNDIFLRLLKDGTMKRTLVVTEHAKHKTLEPKKYKTSPEEFQNMFLIFRSSGQGLCGGWLISTLPVNNKSVTMTQAETGFGGWLAKNLIANAEKMIGHQRECTVDLAVSPLCQDTCIWVFVYLCIYVFVYLCIWVFVYCVFVYQTFPQWTLPSVSFVKIT